MRLKNTYTHKIGLVRIFVFSTSVTEI